MVGERIFVVDRVTTRPGRAREFVDAYLADYAPGALRRGMTLDRILVSPPLWSGDQANTVTITWTVEGVGAWWDMTRSGRGDPAPARWWTAVDELIVERSREMAAGYEDVEVLGCV
ncbi:hypothetical protein G4X40_06335 [Rhodococcus sp. D2-41]|uniref:NIPSNAP domain-containing protein n=1 Tax=Speluncibacter jeojiensis TaxID=2710754 RepID=A0A9X4RDU7_9ACTN|nr:hypothetical protein [Rhodococcus sp. D2-41]MDG3009763.1 hypothetical protein [Rhodococcus sp. D2-41]MDG3014512.1 hypothetical protein [Corynebacteriales bacterium D3-21]